MLGTSPMIPENAPFTSQQREWLNGLLADVLTKRMAAVPAGLKVAVYFATQSGTAERLAKKLMKSLKAEEHAVELLSMEKAMPSSLAAHEHAFFLASTYGEGDPPDGAKAFRAALLDEGAPRLSSLRYSVFCLGDKNYEHFCRFGIELDERLKALGARALAARVESDVDVDAPFAAWAKQVAASLTNTPAAAVVSEPLTAAVIEEPAQVHTRENPFYAELRERWELTTPGSSKQTLHLSFALEDAAMHYSAGDACGVLAQNDPTFVDRVLHLLPFRGDVTVQVPKAGRFTVKDALLHHLQPTRLTRRVVQMFAERAQCNKLAAMLPGDQVNALEAFLYGRDLVDLLEQHPGVVASPDDLVAMLPRLAPRLYSISSSPAAHGREVHCTVGVVRYKSFNRQRGGVASTMFADRVAAGERLPIYIHPNKKFRLPADGNVPIVMIGPGTGIAPFRAFLHERRALAQRGRNWLFFGERSADTDFLYRNELQAMKADGHLARLDTAFSRDQAHKVYVQDRMRENGAELWRWLSDGAQLYVCGDASRMAKDVDAALHQVVEQYGAMDGEAAREYVLELQDAGRYHKDVY